MSAISPVPESVAIFCDDIREELHGKTTYVGVYGPDLLLSGPPGPVILPLLCCMVRINFDPEALPNDVVIQLRKFDATGDQGPISAVEIPGGKNIPMPEYHPGFGDETMKIQLMAGMKISPLIVDKECTLRAIVILDGAEHRIGSLNIRRVEQLPPSQ